MLEGLDAIDWAALEHAYGDASSVPGDLRGLTSSSKKVRDAAYSNLKVSVYHQGAGYTAIPASVPFLIELLGEPEVQDRARILDFLTLLSEAHRWIEWGLRETLDLPNRAWIDQVFPPPNQEIFATAYEAVYRGVSRYRGLLNDPDHTLRSSAARILSFDQDSAEGTLPLVLNRLEVERKLSTKASVTLCLGFLIRHTGRDDLTPLLRGQLDAKRLLLRFAAAAGLCNAGQPVDVPVQRALWDTIVDGEEADLPWLDRETPDYYALRLLQSLHHSKLVDAGDLLLDAAVEVSSMMGTLRTKARKGHGAILSSLVEGLIWIAFPKEPPTERKPLPQNPTWSDLESFQRRLLRALVRNISPVQAHDILRHRHDRPLLEAGLPRFTELSALDDIPPPGEYGSILEQPLFVELGEEARFDPLSLWWERVVVDGLEPEALFDAMSEQLCLCENHEAIEHMLGREEHGAGLLRGLISRLGSSDAHLAALHDRARTLLERGFLPATPREAEERTRLFFAWALARAYRTRELEIPKLVDALLNEGAELFEFTSVPDELREVLAMLPRDRRARAIDRFSIRSFAEPDEAWTLYDLCPSAQRTRKLLRLMKSDPEFFCVRAAHRAVEVLAAQNEDGIAELIKALRSRKRSDRHLIAVAIAMSPGADELDLTPWLDDRDQRIQTLFRWRKDHEPPIPRELLLEVGIDARRAQLTNRAKGGVVGIHNRPWDGKSWRRE